MIRALPNFIVFIILFGAFDAPTQAAPIVPTHSVRPQFVQIGGDAFDPLAVVKTNDLSTAFGGGHVGSGLSLAYPPTDFVGLDSGFGRLGGGIRSLVAEVNRNPNAYEASEPKKQTNESIPGHLFSSIRRAPLLAQISLALVYGAAAYGLIAFGGSGTFLPKRRTVKRAMIWLGFTLLVVGPLCLIVGASPYA